MDEEQKKQAREVTKTLADLDIFFTVGEVHGVPTWTMLFASQKPGESGIGVNIQVHGGWVVVFHQVGGEVSRDTHFPAAMLRQLLELNGQLAIAKVALDAQGYLGVVAQIAFSRLSPESLKEAVGAVMTGAQQIQSLLGIAPAGTPQIQH